MPTIELTAAQIRPGKSAAFPHAKDGPDQLVVWAKTPGGETFDFEVAVPRGQGFDYLSRLGFKEATQVVAERVSKGGREVTRETTTTITL